MKVSGPKSDLRNLPRDWVIGTALPMTDCAAVAPMQTSSLGRSTSISVSSQGLHVVTCLIEGF